jgi:hypothetical protein
VEAVTLPPRYTGVQNGSVSIPALKSVVASEPRDDTMITSTRCPGPLFFGIKRESAKRPSQNWKALLQADWHGLALGVKRFPSRPRTEGMVGICGKRSPRSKHNYKWETTTSLTPITRHAVAQLT